MSMTVGVVKEIFPGERRVALVPLHVPQLVKAGLEVTVQSGAGLSAGYEDEAYREKGARVSASADEVLGSSDILLSVRNGAGSQRSSAVHLPLMRDGAVIIGLLEPYKPSESFKLMMKKRMSVFSLEFIPRISRAQTMDVLSSMASVSGYKAAILAAEMLPRMFPMLMTAAGTIIPAKVFIIGAGVAGLQAIATAHRLGAVVNAYDVRPEVREQVESLGARFVELPIETKGAESTGGYAAIMDDEFYRKQRELMGETVAGSDVVITTASVPGKPAPVLVTAEMVSRMAPGSVIIDLAASGGGNCELSEPGKSVVKHGVTIFAALDLPSTVPFHSSQLYSKNISSFLLSMVKDGTFSIDREDEIVRDTAVMIEGEVVQDRVREFLGL